MIAELTLATCTSSLRTPNDGDTISIQIGPRLKYMFSHYFCSSKIYHICSVRDRLLQWPFFTPNQNLYTQATRRPQTQCIGLYQSEFEQTAKTVDNIEIG